MLTFLKCYVTSTLDLSQGTCTSEIKDLCSNLEELSLSCGARDNSPNIYQGGSVCRFFWKSVKFILLSPAGLAQWYSAGLTGLMPGPGIQRWFWGSSCASDFETHGQSHPKQRVPVAPYNGPQSNTKVCPAQ